MQHLPALPYVDTLTHIIASVLWSINRFNSRKECYVVISFNIFSILSSGSLSHISEKEDEQNQLTKNESTEEEDDGLDLADFVAIGDDENNVDFDDESEMFDLMNDVSADDQTIYGHGENDVEVLGVKLPVDISQPSQLEQNEEEDKEDGDQT